MAPRCPRGAIFCSDCGCVGVPRRAQERRVPTMRSIDARAALEASALTRLRHHEQIPGFARASAISSRRRRAALRLRLPAAARPPRSIAARWRTPRGRAGRGRIFRMVAGDVAQAVLAQAVDQRGRCRPSRSRPRTSRRARRTNTACASQDRRRERGAGLGRQQAFGMGGAVMVRHVAVLGLDQHVAVWHRPAMRRRDGCRG